MPSLCERCRHVRVIVTPRGSRFLLCRLSQVNPAYPRYPAQPVYHCQGYDSSPAPEAGPPDHAAGER